MTNCNDQLLQSCLEGIQGDGWLWHYTSVEAFLKILDHQYILMNSYRFMNDPSEGQVASELLEDCANLSLHSFKTERPKFDFQTLIAGLKSKATDQSERGTERATFVLSGSRDKDLLSQWARYGDDGRGVCLGFRVDCEKWSMPKSSTGGSSENRRSAAVQYWSPTSRTYGGQWETDRESQKMRDWISKIDSALERLVVKDASTDSVLRALRHTAEALAPIVKRSPYSVEREVRCIVEASRDAPDNYIIRSTRYGLAPAYKLPLSDAGLTLTEIVLGPQLTPDDRRSFEWLQAKHGLQQVKLDRSALAYR